MKKPIKLTSEQKVQKEKKKATMIIFINGKQKRVKRPTNNDEMSEFERNNADAMYWHINEEWENIVVDASNSTLIINDKCNVTD